MFYLFLGFILNYRLYLVRFKFDFIFKTIADIKFGLSTLIHLISYAVIHTAVYIFYVNDY